MKTIEINEAYCPKNHHCPVISSCPTGAIRQSSPFQAPQIDQEKCTGCGRCSKFCRTFQMVDKP